MTKQFTLAIEEMDYFLSVKLLDTTLQRIKY
jgi:hypothetical protein